jgi:hypothetical protein
MRIKNGLNPLSFRVCLTLLTLFFFAACPVPENNTVREPVDRVQLSKNQESLTPRGEFKILEGQSVILGARLFPEGVTGGIHWQSSRRGILDLSALAGPEITITGMNGGKTTVSVMARNPLNEVYAEAECTVIVIPSSFFKWNFRDDGWVDMEAHENVMVGKIGETPVRSGETPIIADIVRGGLVLEGPGALIIGSGMTTPTNSTFPDDPAYDVTGELDFLNGPGYFWVEGTTPHNEYYPFWKDRVKITVEYEILRPGQTHLRIQVNNNTLEKYAASAVDNWLVAEMDSAVPSGKFTGVYSGKGVAKFDPLLDPAKQAGIGEIDRVLSRSFVCLALPDGKIVIRSIRIESAD